MAETIAPPQELTEARLQQDCVMWFNREYRALSDLLFAIPNGEKRDKVTAARLQAQGVKAGVPDMLLAKIGNKVAPHSPDWYPANISYGLFIEMKTGIGRLSPDQQRIIPQLQQAGYRVEVIRSLEAFQQLIQEYLA